MEFKGTKGNWKVDSYDNTLVRPDIRYTNEGICRCFSKNYTGNKFEDQANALLISKAPEMLEMLKILIQDIEEEGNYSRQTGYDIEEAKKLIKSATEI